MDTIELLLKKQLITKEDVDKAKSEVKRTGIKLEAALEKLAVVSQEDIARVKADALDVPYIDLNDYIIDSELIKLVPENLARKYKVIPIFKIADTLTLAMVEPQNITALDVIRKVSGIDIVEPVLASERSVLKLLDSSYGVKEAIDEIVNSIEKAEAGPKTAKDLAELAEEAPIIKLVNIVIMQATKDKASDIHVEPEDDTVRIRYRIDGILHETNTLPKKLQGAVISRVKILAGMDIAEMRRPQDGRIRIKFENKELDIRVSTFPTVHGENVVMRLLDKSQILLNIKDLGFSKAVLDNFSRAIHSPDGIILVTGPTGSGKTTTLYAALTTINSIEKNIITIEDPVEYELPLIRQTQVNVKAGMSFANGLRSMLRQDPDIIMVGEIRDRETVETAIQAALTGHLVFSTLHTNDAPSALTRLIDMGVEPFLISSSVIAVLAQRLVRTICDRCKEKYVPSQDMLDEVKIKNAGQFFRGKGCEVCKETGYKGRIGIFEFFTLNEEIRDMINHKQTADQIRQKAKKLGMKTLLEDGLAKAQAGLTTLDEVLRVTKIE